MKRYEEPILRWIPISKQDIVTSSDSLRDPYREDVFPDDL